MARGFQSLALATISLLLILIVVSAQHSQLATATAPSNNAAPLVRYNLRTEVLFLLIAVGLTVFLVAICVIAYCYNVETAPQLESTVEKKKLTVDQAVEYLGYGRFQYFLLIIVGVTQMAHSMEVMILSFLMPEVKSYWNISMWQVSLIGSSVFLGKLIGSLVWGNLSDKIGRRLGSLTVFVLTSIFGLASVFAPNYWVLALLRLFVGIGVGGDIVSMTLFAEFLPIESRASGLMNAQTFWCLGSVGVPFMAMLFLPKEATRFVLFGTDGWRWLLGASVIPFIILIPMGVFMPESPRFLLISNRIPELNEMFARAARWNRKPHDFEIVPLENQKIVTEHKGRLSDLFSKSLISLTLLILVLWVTEGLCYYGVSFLTPQYFESKSSGIYDKYWSTIFSSLSEVPGQAIALLLTYKLGRKKSMALLYGISALAVFFLLLPVHYVVLTLDACVARAAIMGATSIVWIYTQEAFPTTLRTSALGLSSAHGRFAGMITPFIQNLLGDVSQLIPVAVYGFGCSAGALVSILLPFETTGRSLKDIHDHELNEQLLINTNTPRHNDFTLPPEDPIQDDIIVEPSKDADQAPLKI